MLPANEHLERAHQLSNKLKMSSEDHAFLIKLLEDVHGQGYSEGYDAGSDETYDYGFEAGYAAYHDEGE